MLQTRVIPVLLLKNRGLYKGVKFKDYKYIGDPINTLKLFNDKEVDEIVIFDIEASRLNKEIDFGYLKEIVTEAFMPVAYGGGIKSVNDARKLFSLGIEKVILNTNAVTDFNLIKDLINAFGSQSIVFSLDIKKTFLGIKVFIKSGTEKTKYNPMEMALKMQSLGVGEIILNDIDRDGTMEGYNLKLIGEIAGVLSIPVIASGGAGKLEDFKQAKEHGAHAMAAGALFVYHGPHRAVLISYPSYNDLRKYLGD